MQKTFLALAILCLGNVSYSQMRIGIVGGAQRTSVVEPEQYPEWNTGYLPVYSPKTGINLGIIGEMPLSASNDRWYFQPSVMYMAKGRKYFHGIDSSSAMVSDTLSTSHTLSTNYLEVPLNITLKVPVCRCLNLTLSAGPYVAFYYNGKQRFETKMYSSTGSRNDEVPLKVGRETGSFNTFDAGLNARVGFEVGNLLAQGFVTRGLTNFYHAADNRSRYHSTAGVSVGFWLNRPEKEKVVSLIDNNPEGLAGGRAVPKTANLRATIVPVTERPGSPASSLTVRAPEHSDRHDNHIIFAPFSDVLQPQYFDYLDAVASLLKGNPEITLLIEGHADISGSARLNDRLSARRAVSVKNYLTTAGVPLDRLKTVSFGARVPRDTNETVIGRINNRRATLKLIR